MCFCDRSNSGDHSDDNGCHKQSLKHFVSCILNMAAVGRGVGPRGRVRPGHLRLPSATPLGVGGWTQTRC